jgi:atypical dual specificity phosphatase
MMNTREGNTHKVQMPAHFHWILPNQLAGMERPGLYREEAEDLAAIAAAGISILISLTHVPVSTQTLRSFGIQGHHFPILHKGAPPIEPALLLCKYMDRAIAGGKRIAVHCHAGMGRTGTILASYLIWKGRSPEEAIARLRSISRGFVQSSAQYDFLYTFSVMAGNV